jgi:hypothetical protein
MVFRLDPSGSSPSEPTWVVMMEASRSTLCWMAALSSGSLAFISSALQKFSPKSPQVALS